MGDRFGDDQLMKVPDKAEVTISWVGIDGWKVIIRSKQLGQKWENARVQVYSELDSGEVLAVLDSALGQWMVG